MSNQDWNQVVIHSGKSTNGTRSKVTKSLTRNITAKYGTPNSHKSKDQLKKSVKEDTGEYTIKKVSLKISKQIQKARLARGMSQKDLAQKINQKSSVISAYEAGKAIPDGRILSQIGKVLGVALRNPKKPKKSKK
jgi:putative transcription factor